MAVIETLGRTQISFCSGTPPMPTPNVSKAIQALTCSSASAPTSSPVPLTAVPGGPTVTPRPTSAGPTEPGPDDVKSCPQLDGRAPAAAIAAAMAAPNRVAGYGLRCSANLPGSPANPYRRNLTLRNIALAYHPLFNGFALRCGCP